MIRYRQRQVVAIGVGTLLAIGIGSTPAFAATVSSPSQNVTQTTSDPWSNSAGTFSWVEQTPDSLDPGISAYAFAASRSFTADFKASVSSSQFINAASGSIKVLLTEVTNCTADWPNISVTLLRKNALGVWVSSGLATFPCTTTDYGYTWTGQSAGTYTAVFARTGPTDFDETTKHVEGIIYFN